MSSIRGFHRFLYTGIQFLCLRLHVNPSLVRCGLSNPTSPRSPESPKTLGLPKIVGNLDHKPEVGDNNNIKNVPGPIKRKFERRGSAPAILETGVVLQTLSDARQAWIRSHLDTTLQKPRRSSLSLVEVGKKIIHDRKAEPFLLKCQEFHNNGVELEVKTKELEEDSVESPKTITPIDSKTLKPDSDLVQLNVEKQSVPNPASYDPPNLDRKLKISRLFGFGKVSSNPNLQRKPPLWDLKPAVENWNEQKFKARLKALFE